jgi:hypothetical protein
MKQETIFILGGFLMLCCCSSSMASIAYPVFFPNESPIGPTGSAGPGASGEEGGGEGPYTYDFYIETPEASTAHDLHLADIKIDGIRAISSQVTMHVQPDRYACGSKTNACLSDTSLGHIDTRGDATWAAWELNTTSAGQKIFTITTSNKVTTFEISYQRPKYTPGWRIEENGTTVVTETSNRGAESTPSPVTYTYTIP